MLRKPVRIHKGWLALATLTAVFLLGMPQSSRASLEIALQETGVNGGAITVVDTEADFSTVTYTGTYGDFSVKVFGGSSDNGATLSDLLDSTTSVENTTGGTKTLNLWITQSNYTLPVGAVLGVSSSLGGSVSLGTLGGTDIFQAYADKNNNLFGTTDYTNGPQSATFNGSSYDTGTAAGLFNNSNGVYSLTSDVTFVLSGGKANYSSEVDVTAVPEPGTVALALTGLPILGLLWARRRRRA